MTNREKYAEEILDIACSGSGISMIKATGQLSRCCKTNCIDCKFNKKTGCQREVQEWANAEYVEKPKISKRDKEFLKYLPDYACWLARDKCGMLYVYRAKPTKDEITQWFSELINMEINKEYKVNFPMVKWEDEEPWLIEDLKKLEVVEEYESN